MIPKSLLLSCLLSCWMLLVFGQTWTAAQGFSALAKQRHKSASTSGGSFCNFSSHCCRPPRSSSTSLLLETTGGGRDLSSDRTVVTTMTSLWGSGGVIYILAKALQRVVPIALEPFVAGSAVVLSPLQWGIYAFTAAFFAYAEGYKGFQTKFTPLVVKRSLELSSYLEQNWPWVLRPVGYLFAPLISMGLFSATRKRIITSWSVTLGVAAIVGIVKRLATPRRNIIDGGVVVGLTWGAASLVVFYVHAIVTKRPPAVDACWPTKKSKQ